MVRLVGRDGSHKLFLCRRGGMWKEKQDTLTLTVKAANKQAAAPEPSPTPMHTNKAACVANNTEGQGAVSHCRCVRKCSYKLAESLRLLMNLCSSVRSVLNSSGTEV